VHGGGEEPGGAVREGERGGVGRKIQDLGEGRKG
jgi:hypothetical protein